MDSDWRNEDREGVPPSAVLYPQRDGNVDAIGPEVITPEGVLLGRSSTEDDYNSALEIVSEEPVFRLGEATAGDLYENPALESARSKVGPQKHWSDDFHRIKASPVNYLQRLTRWLNQGIFDRFAGIRYALKEAGVIGKTIDNYINGYVKARLSTSVTDRLAVLLKHGQMKWTDDGVLEPIEGTQGFLEVLEPVADRLDDFGLYLIGRRAEDLEAMARQTGFSPDEIRAMKELGDVHPDFEEVAAKYMEINQSVLDIAEQAGLINHQNRLLWEQENYIPFYRIMENGTITPKSTGSGISGQDAGIRYLRGSDRPLGDPIENIMMNWAHLLDASVKNVAALQVIDDLRGSGFFSKAKNTFQKRLVGAEEARQRVEELLLEAGTDPGLIDMVSSSPTLRGLTKLWSIEAPKGKDVIKVMRNGKPMYYHVHDQLLYRSMTNFNERKWTKAMAFWQYPKRWLTRFVTADPAFMLRNFTRDVLSAWALGRDPFVPGMSAVTGAMKAFREDPDMVRYMAAGGTFSTGGYVNSGDPAEMKRFIEAESHHKKFKNVITSSPKAALDFWTKLGTSIENANRIAIAQAAEKGGKGAIGAAYEMKDIMDFSMRGDFYITQILAETVPFFSARLQGLQRLGRGAYEHPGAFAAKGALIVMASMLLYWRNKDDDRYKELEEWDKDTYYHFFIGEDHYRMPKPFEVGMLFGTMPERIVDAWHSDDPKAVGFLMDRMYWNFTQTLAMNPIPQTMRPIAEQWANKSFFTDRPIVGQRLQNLEQSVQYEPWTSETMREMGRLFGVSPKRAESIVRGYFGTVGMYVLGITDTLLTRNIVDFPDNPEKQIDEMPVLKSFMRGSGPAKNTKYINSFYEMVKEANQLQSAIRELQRQGEWDRALQMRNEELDKLKARPALNKRRAALSKINKRIRQIHYSDTMTPELKRQNIDRLLDIRNRIAQGGYDKYNKYFD
jgi:hypothetical protein